MAVVTTLAAWFTTVVPPISAGVSRITAPVGADGDRGVDGLGAVDVGGEHRERRQREAVPVQHERHGAHHDDSHDGRRPRPPPLAHPGDRSGGG